MPKNVDGKTYLEPGDSVDVDAAQFTVVDNGTGVGNGTLGDASIVKYWDEENDEWHECNYDFEGSSETNPMYGRLYYEE